MALIGEREQDREVPALVEIMVIVPADMIARTGVIVERICMRILVRTRQQGLAADFFE